MSTDTAFALGMLALVGRRFPQSLRAFILTVAVVDDLVAFVVIVTVYSHSIRVAALLAGLAALAVALVIRLRRVRNGVVYLVLGLVAWVALYKSGVDPVIVGVFIGLIAIAYPAARADLEGATDLFRLFREQPTSETAQSLRQGVRSALSPNERLQQIFHPVSSYVIVPLFALANAGIVINGSFLSRAYGSPITIGIIVGYVVGKPIGITGATWLVTRLSHGRIRPPVGWASVLGGGAIAGIGFTVSILIASLAFDGVELQEAKLGVLTAAVGASLLTALVFRITTLLPRRTRLRALVGCPIRCRPRRAGRRRARPHPGTDGRARDARRVRRLRVPVLRQGRVDHPRTAGRVRRSSIRMAAPAAQRRPSARAARRRGERGGRRAGQVLGDVRHAAHPSGRVAARDLVAHAEGLGLDVERFREHLRKRKGAGRIAEDVESADASGVSGTPTFFINGRRHYGAYDVDTLSREVKAARARVAAAEPLDLDDART